VVAELAGVGDLGFVAGEGERRMRAHAAMVRATTAGTLGGMRPSTRAIVRPVVALVAMAVGILAIPTAATAHTELDYTVPADGATVGEPVDEIVVAFTEPVAIVGNGFEVLDPQGDILRPLTVSDDDMVVRLQLDPPLAGGPVGVRYEIAAADGHVLQGSFSFTVAAPAETVPPTAPPTPPPTTATPPTTLPNEPATQPAPDAPSSTVATTVTVPPSTGADPSAAGTDVVPSAADDPTDDLGDGGTAVGVVLAIGGALALAAVVFVFVRTRG
jgi:methionine-rich copper-binding protein CopC